MGVVKTPKKQENRAAKNLRAIRDKWDFSVPEMAMALGVRANTLVTWEKEDREPKVSSLGHAAWALGCKPESLFGATPPVVDEIRPAFGLGVIDEEASPTAIEALRHVVAEANAAYRATVRLQTTQGKPVVISGPKQIERQALAARGKAAPQLAKKGG